MNIIKKRKNLDKGKKIKVIKKWKFQKLDIKKFIPTQLKGIIKERKGIV